MDDYVRRDETQFPLEDIESAADALRLMTGDDDPRGARDSIMSEEERGGPFVYSSSRRELSRPEDDQDIDQTWDREAYPMAMADDHHFSSIDDALLATEANEEENLVDEEGE